MAVALRSLPRVDNARMFGNPAGAVANGDCSATDATHHPYYVNNFACQVFDGNYVGNVFTAGWSARAMRLGEFCFMEYMPRFHKSAPGPGEIITADAAIPQWAWPLHDVRIDLIARQPPAPGGLGLQAVLQLSTAGLLTWGTGFDGVGLFAQDQENLQKEFTCFVYRLADPSATILPNRFGGVPRTNISNTSTAASQTSDATRGPCHYRIKLNNTKPMLEYGAVTDDGLQSPYHVVPVIESSVDGTWESGMAGVVIRSHWLRLHHFMVASVQGTGLHDVGANYPHCSEYKPCFGARDCLYQASVKQVPGPAYELMRGGTDAGSTPEIRIRDIGAGTGYAGAIEVVGPTTVQQTFSMSASTDLFDDPPYTGITEAVVGTTGCTQYDYKPWNDDANANDVPMDFETGYARKVNDRIALHPSMTHVRAYEQGVTTLTLGGPWAGTHDVYVAWIRINNFVFATFTNVQGAPAVAAQRITTTAGALPAHVRPFITAVQPIWLFDNTAYVWGLLYVTTAGEMEIGVGGTSAALSGLGFAGFGALLAVSSGYIAWPVDG